MADLVKPSLLQLSSKKATSGKLQVEVTYLGIKFQKDKEPGTCTEDKSFAVAPCQRRSRTALRMLLRTDKLLSGLQAPQLRTR